MYVVMLDLVASWTGLSTKYERYGDQPLPSWPYLAAKKLRASWRVVSAIACSDTLCTDLPASARSVPETLIAKAPTTVSARMSRRMGNSAMPRGARWKRWQVIGGGSLAGCGGRCAPR